MLSWEQARKARGAHLPWSRFRDSTIGSPSRTGSWVHFAVLGNDHGPTKNSIASDMVVPVVVAVFHGSRYQS